MSANLMTLIVLLSPVVFAATAIASWFQPGFKPKLVKTLSLTSAIITIIIAGFSSFQVYQHGLIESELLGLYELGFSIRLDALSILMFSMIALLGFIIIKFSSNYLDGDHHQGAFIGRLAATIASVQLLVLAGNIALLLAAWVLTSISLNRLLVFYKERPGAQIAARKKYILARLGDLSLFISLGLLYNHFGSGNLEVIFNAISGSTLTDIPFLAIEAPALFLVLAAVLKSAQFPTHGWLIEVMETPTPVSALLHAGLLNAGPFLIIRMAMVMDASTVAPIVLITIGGLTALFGSIVFLTQTSVKTALGYSSVAHMGFSLMVCGLGVYAAAMLHLVAHSFYKAHSFLSSGSIIDVIRGSKVATNKQSVGTVKIILGIILSLTIYAGFAFVWGIDPEKDLSLLIIGAVIIMGLSRIFTSAFAAKGKLTLLLQASLLALIVTTAFFSLESMMHHLLADQFPDITQPGTGKLIVAATLLALFGTTVYIQIMAPQITKKPAYQALAVHFRNGFYANAWFDRFVGALDIHSPESKQILHHQPTATKQAQKSAVKESDKPFVKA